MYSSLRKLSLFSLYLLGRFVGAYSDSLLSLLIQSSGTIASSKLLNRCKENIAYYTHRFVWQAQGLSLAARVKYLEERWAYFLGFGMTPKLSQKTILNVCLGLPTTALCVMGSSLANAAVFALIFPSVRPLALHN
jgi:hypothetical protein